MEYINMRYRVLIILLNLIITEGWTVDDSASRISNGILYPRQRFIPSDNHFHLALHKSRNRLRCINLCQESSFCQTVMYDRIKQECTLFSEHIEYGFGRLVNENTDHLITIRLDKDSRTMKTKTSRTISTPFRKQDENCEL